LASVPLQGSVRRLPPVVGDAVAGGAEAARAVALGFFVGVAVGCAVGPVVPDGEAGVVGAAESRPEAPTVGEPVGALTVRLADAAELDVELDVDLPQPVNDTAIASQTTAPSATRRDRRTDPPGIIGPE
jgi:hypothetical protein